MKYNYCKLALLATMVISLTPSAYANNMDERKHLYTYFNTHQEAKASPAIAPAEVAKITDEEQVRQTLNQWIVAVNSRAPERVAKLYETNAVLQPAICNMMHDTPGMRINYLNHLTDSAYVHATLNRAVVRIKGDIAIVDGTYTFTHSKRKKATTTPERFSMVLERTGGTWLITDHHASKVPPRNHYNHYSK
jgi:uncharacterized protein (TIGR02246 family)